MSDYTELQDIVSVNQNLNNEEHDLIHQEIATANTLRQAGDDAVGNSVTVVRNNTNLNSTGLSKEAIHRVEGDLLSQKQYEDLLRAFTGEWGTIKLSVLDLSIDMSAKFIAVDNQLSNLESSLDLVEANLSASILDVKLELKNDVAVLRNKVAHYEVILSDITLDSNQITMDNGEIRMGAWTILSQAREWDLEILAKLSGLKLTTETIVNDALEDFQNSLPNTESIINEAILELSKSPIITNLDKSLTANIGDVVKLQEALTQEALARQQEILLQAQLDVERARALSQELKTDVLDVAAANADALAREASIRAEQLRLEALELAKVAEDLVTESQARIAAVLKEKADREAALEALVIDAEFNLTEINKHIDESVASLNTNIAEVNTKADGITTKLTNETTDRIAAVKLISDGLTSEITNRVAGDTANLNVINNYKLSNDTALANVQEQVTLNTTSNSANATKISALDVRLTTNDTATVAANSLAATAVSKAETALTENTAQASQISGLNTSIESINGSLLTKADASALTALDTKVTNQGGLVTSQGTAITKLTNDLTALNTKTDTKASSAVVSALDSKVTSIDGRVTSQGTSITSLTNRLTLAEGTLSKKAESSAVTSLESKVTQQGLDITSQGASITRIDASIDATNLAVATKASAAALSTLDSKVTSIDGKVSSNTSAITALTGRVTATEGALTTKASVDAVNSLTTRITSAEGTIASQATSITSLNSGLVTTNTNVTAAQTAANSANTLAGGKGKVFFQNAEPAVADRLAQNLWIDTTGNNNTPKRWLTNAWVAVNDKIATDALTAANAANVAIATKADATALSSLDSKVTTINGTVTSQGASITNLNTRLSSAEGTLTTKANSSAVSALDSKVTQQGNTITSQGTDITKLKADLALTNTAVSTKASSEALQTLDNRVVSIDGKVTTNASAITALNGKMTTVENGLATKLDASVISEYYTKIQADTVTTGKIDEFNASLVIGGVNLVVGSNDVAQFNNGVGYTVQFKKGTPNSIKNISNNGGISTYTQVFVSTNIGTVYTASVQVKPDATTKLRLFIAIDASTTPLTVPLIDCPAGVWTTVWGTFQAKAASCRLSGFQVASAGGFTDNVTVEYKEYQVERGTKATAWAEAPSEIKAQIADVVTANANAIQNTNSEVSRVNGVVVSQGTALTKLTGDLATTNGTLATKADGSALTALTNRVTSAEGVNTTQSTNITTLTNNLATTNTNLSTKADTSAVTALDSKVAGIDGRVTANTSSITSLSGRVTTTENGLATKADTSAVTALTTRVGTVEGGLSSASSNITKLESSLNAVNSGASLIPDYAMADVNSWRSHYGYNLGSYFQTTSTGKITNTVFVKPADVATCWNYSKTLLPNDRTYKLSMWVRRPVGATGTIYFTAGLHGISGLFLTYSNVPKPVIADDTWQYVEQVWNLTTVADTKQLAFGFALNHPIAGFKCEMQGFKVEAVITNADTDNTIASSAALTATNSEVTRINGVVVSQGSSITTLQGNISTINGTLSTKADGSALTALTTRVTNAEGVNTTQSGQITTLTNNLSTTDGKVANKAESSAVSTLDSKVTAVDGRVTSNSSLITSLSGRVTTTENNIATKAEASALNKYYTKEQSDTAIAGKISEFSSKLDIGGVNQLLNSAAARTAAPREYMVYERSEELKAFFDELMRTGQDFVVSGEISVPVAGSVQVYSGNGSFHTFSGGVNVTEVNKFVRFVVTYPNAYLREQGANANRHATQSTLEFYGTYDSGRFPTVRNVQLEAGTKATSWSPSPRDTQAALTANATAISTTNTEVSRVNGVVVNQGTQLTNLNATLTTLSGTVNTKADAAALTSLTTRVTNAEGVNTSQGSSITKLTNDLVTANTAINTKASSAAVTTLDNKVAAVDGKVTTNASAITNLTGRITAAESGINTKADSAALTTLTNRVSTAEGKLTADATSITSLNSSLAKVTDVVTVKDTRSTNQPPSWYFTNYPNRIINEFKQTAAISVSEFFGGVYCNLETKVYWTDPSGGDLIQTAMSSVDPSLYAQRRSSGTTAWTPWVQPVKDLRTELTTKASAAALTTLDTKVTSINGVVTATANSLTTLQSTVGANTSAISIQGSVINGIKAEYTIKTDVNGLVSGIGLINDGTTSAIGINANTFFVGAPAGGKKPFIITTTVQVINGITYPIGTWIDVALIANATIGTAKIQDLAVTTAKIANLAVTDAKIESLNAAKITAGFISADRIEGKSITADKISAAAIEAISVAARSYTTIGADGSKQVISGGKTEIFYPNGQLAYRAGVW